MPESPIFWHHVRFSFIFPGIAPRFPLFSSTSCLDPLVILMALQHRARIPYFSASCPVSFYLSRHCARISFVFSDIALGSYISSGIVSGFLLSFSTSRSDFLYFLLHRAWILYLSRKHIRFSPIFSGTVPGFPLFSPTSSLDLISLPKTRPIFSYLFWHRVQIPLAFSGSVPGSFNSSVIVAHSLSLFMVVWGQNCWLFEFFTRVHFTHSLLALCIHDSLVHSLY